MSRMRIKMFLALVAIVSCGARFDSPIYAGNVRAGDSWWMMDTRSLADCPSADTPQLRVRHCVNNAWTTSSLEAFLAESGEGTTVFHIHGNRIPACEVAERGAYAYRALIANSNAPAFRFVLWSWPSDKVKGQLKDVLYKADRSDTEAWYLGWILNQLPENHHVSLLGYSFGARIATGAVHLRAGGSVNGNALPFSSVAKAPVRVSLLAAALNCEWLSPGGQHELAAHSIDRFFVAYNSCDPALQRYRRLDRCTKPSAMGYVGLPCSSELANRTLQIDACPCNGRTHEEAPYYQSSQVVNALRNNLLWIDGATTQATKTTSSIARK